MNASMGISAQSPVALKARSNTLHLTIRYEDAGDGWLTAQVAEGSRVISEAKHEEARSVIDALDVPAHSDEEFAVEHPPRKASRETQGRS